MQILFVLILLGLFFLLSRFILTWQYRRAQKSIFHELNSAKATTASQAIVLNYEKPFYQRIGFRDYRPYVLRALVQANVIRQTEEGKFYLDVSSPEYKRFE